MAERKASISRETKETTIHAEINLDGSGEFVITTGIRMFDHLLDQLARHGTFDLKISAVGPDQHHVVEDVALCLGKAFTKALGERKAIVRTASAVVPMDDALVLVAVDIGGRGYAVVEATFTEIVIGELSVDLIRHFLVSFANEAKLNVHARILAGINDHHKAEALFKALARCLDSATRIDQRLAGKTPSTKEMIEG